jgi:hypothetical protein
MHTAAVESIKQGFLYHTHTVLHHGPFGTAAAASRWIRHFLCSSVRVDVPARVQFELPWQERNERVLRLHCLPSALSCPSQVVITATLGLGYSSRGRPSGGAGCSPLVSIAGIITDMTAFQGVEDKVSVGEAVQCTPYS